MRCLIHLVVLVIMMYVACTMQSPIVRNASSREETGVSVEVSNARRDVDTEIAKVKLMLKRVLEKASKRSRRRQRGFRRYFGNRKLKCLQRNSRGRCIRFAILGMWQG